MCTVTFIPLEDHVFITHNRDEQKSRSRALPPAKYLINGYTVLFPKDSKAGGSWIGINEHGRAAVLINGAFHKHIPVPPYRKSRGLIFLDILATDDLLQTFQTIDLENIEPFTLIIWNRHEFAECRWDACHKHVSSIAPDEVHVWSSSTLYDEGATAKRHSWFTEWQQQHPFPAKEEIIQFHLSGGADDTTDAIRMNREAMLLTVSITQMEITQVGCMMKYLDLQDGAAFQEELLFVKAMEYNQ